MLTHCEREGDAQNRSEQPGSRRSMHGRAGSILEFRGNHFSPWVYNESIKAAHHLIRDMGYRRKTADVDQYINCYGNQGSAADIH